MANVIPEIAVSNMEESLAFYETLGFVKDNTGIVDDQGSQWYSLALGDAAIWLTRKDVVGLDDDNTPRGVGVNIYIAVDDADPIYDKIKGGKYASNIAKEIETMWYGRRHFSVTDLDGYMLSFIMEVAQEEPVGSHAAS